MSVFLYKAIGADGKSINGEMDATDRKQVIKKLSAKNLRPITVKISNQTENEQVDETINYFKSDKKSKSRGISLGYYSKSKLSLNFLRKLLELLSSGLPLGDAVKLMSIRLSDPNLKDLTNKLWKKLSEGRTLAASMADFPDLFNDSSVHLIEAGEASGNLAPILDRIVAYMEEISELRTKIINSLTYPIFICTVAFGVVLFFLLFLLPKIENMLKSLGGEMQFFAKLLIDSSNLAVKFGPVFLIILTTIVFLTLQWRKTPKGKKVSDGWLLRLPFVGNILLYAEIFQISSLMSTLMSSGVNTTETLRLCEKTINNTLMRIKFNVSRQQIQEGVGLATAFSRHHFMPDLATDILTVGENTGNIVTSLKEINKIYRRELTQSLSLMTTIISSGALIFAFSLVLIIALSIIFSVFQISNTLSG